MAHTSLQVCMDSSDWLQGTMSDEMSTGLDSSSSPSGECMLAAACSSRGGDPAAPLMERRLRPPHDLNLKCPRCDSTHTKFCYYNNYSLSQPRYFCKTCRRYWTKGGTLRNIPVGGGCRKNKKSSSKKSSSSNDHQGTPQGSMAGIGSVLDANNPTELHLSTLSFPQVQFPPHLANLIGAQMSLGGGGGGGDFIESGSLIRPIDFMESKYEGLVGVGGTRGHDFLGSGINGGGDQFGVLSGIGDHHHHHVYNATPYGVSGNDIHEGNYSSGGIGFMDQRLLLPYDHHGNNHDEHNHNHNHHHHPQSGLMDVKPNPKLLSLEWQDHHGCTSDAHGKDSSFGYNVNGGTTLGPWSGMMSGFQPSTTNSLV